MPTSTRRTDLAGLEAFALGQGGYLDRQDAHDYGITDSLLGYHTRTGRFERVLPFQVVINVLVSDRQEER